MHDRAYSRLASGSRPPWVQLSYRERGTGLIRLMGNGIPREDRCR
jgi:hypothetical protein